ACAPNSGTTGTGGAGGTTGTTGTGGATAGAGGTTGTTGTGGATAGAAWLGNKTPVKRRLRATLAWPALRILGQLELEELVEQPVPLVLEERQLVLVEQPVPPVLEERQLVLVEQPVTPVLEERQLLKEFASTAKEMSTLIEHAIVNCGAKSTVL
ncbi:hypothetical protein OSTOST_17415, partial [Ostertagia ostertagi]